MVKMFVDFWFFGLSVIKYVEIFNYYNGYLYTYTCISGNFYLHIWGSIIMYRYILSCYILMVKWMFTII